MAISARKLVYDFQRKYNSINGGGSNTFRVIDIVSFLNDAYQILVEHLIEEEDQNRTISNHLKDLFIKKKKLRCRKVDRNCCKFDFPEDHYVTSNIIVEACNECCDDPKDIIVRTLQSSDLQSARKDPYLRSNFFFEQLIGDEAHDGYYIYHDCEMSINHVFIDYYKKIKRIEAPSLVECEDHIYRDWDESIITKDCDLELCSTYIERKISSVAAYLASTAGRDYNFNTAKLREIQAINQLHN